MTAVAAAQQGGAGPGARTGALADAGVGIGRHRRRWSARVAIVAALAMAFAVPVAIGVALFISHYAPRRLAQGLHPDPGRLTAGLGLNVLQPDRDRLQRGDVAVVPLVGLAEALEQAATYVFEAGLAWTVAVLV